MSLKEFWQALHAVLLYDRGLDTVFRLASNAVTESIRQQLRNFLTDGQ